MSINSGRTLSDIFKHFWCRPVQIPLLSDKVFGPNGIAPVCEHVYILSFCEYIRTSLPTQYVCRL